jgi:hypothetical protein
MGGKGITFLENVQYHKCPFVVIIKHWFLESFGALPNHNLSYITWHISLKSFMIFSSSG